MSVIKGFVLISIIITITYCNVNSQTQSNETVAIGIGYHNTGFDIDEATEFNTFLTQIASLFGASTSYFTAEGVEIVVSKSLNNKFYGNIAVKFYSESETYIQSGATDVHYDLSGMQIPFTLNYNFLSQVEKFNVSLGLGPTYTYLRFKQWVNYTDKGVITTEELTQLENHEFGFTLRPAGQYLPHPNIIIEFAGNFTMNTNGRYSDGPEISVRYVFRRKNSIN